MKTMNSYDTFKYAGNLQFKSSFLASSRSHFTSRCKPSCAQTVNRVPHLVFTMNFAEIFMSHSSSNCRVRQQQHSKILSSVLIKCWHNKHRFSRQTFITAMTQLRQRFFGAVLFQSLPHLCFPENSVGLFIISALIFFLWFLKSYCSSVLFIISGLVYCKYNTKVFCSSARLYNY